MLTKSKNCAFLLLPLTCFLLSFVSANPIVEEKTREPRQVNIRQKPDGTIVASFSAANAINAPGMDNSFALSETFEIGPRGSSSSSSTSFNGGVGPSRMSFANSQSQNSRIDPFGGGGGFSAANAAANSFSNPLFSGANAQANAFNNQFGGFGR